MLEGTTSAAPPQEPYADSLPGLVDKHLLSRIKTGGGYGSVIVVVWFLVIAWFFVSDQYENRLNDWTGLAFLGLKIVGFSIFGLIAATLLRKRN